MKTLRQVLTPGLIFRFLGITDEVTDCGCCGRTGLKKTVGLKSVETGEVHYFGSDCAAKALRWARYQGKPGKPCVPSSFKGISTNATFEARNLSYLNSRIEILSAVNA